jgi:hypothetical protein
MTDEQDESTQETPGGHTIPVPAREDVFRDLGKAAKPLRPGRNGGDERGDQPVD